DLATDAGDAACSFGAVLGDDILLTYSGGHEVLQLLGPAHFPWPVDGWPRLLWPAWVPLSSRWYLYRCGLRPVCRRIPPGYLRFACGGSHFQNNDSRF